MSSIVKNHGRKTKSSGEVSSKREAQVAHSRSFADLFKWADEEAGLPGDQVPYWDPMGFLGREPINLKDQMYEKWKPAFEAFNDLSREGYPLAEAAKEVSKAIDTTSYSLPIYFTPNVYFSDGQDTPLADMLARTAVQENQIKVDELTGVGDASSFSEGAAAWPENDDTTANHTYDVVSYGRQNQVTDFVQLSASGLRSTRALTEEQQVRSIRQYEEKQLIQGNDTNADAADHHDTNGFKGLRDFAESNSNLSAEAGAAITLAKVRDNIRSLRRDGADRSNILHVTDHKTYQDLQADLQDFTRYDSPSDDLDFGFQTLEIDGTPIFESHGCPNSANSREFWTFDASAHYLGMLQDVTMHPLARDSPAETFATDAYGTFVSEAPSRVVGYEGLA